MKNILRNSYLFLLKLKNRKSHTNALNFYLSKETAILCLVLTYFLYIMSLIHKTGSILFHYEMDTNVYISLLNTEYTKTDT
jgi:hypothetical protein